MQKLIKNFAFLSVIPLPIYFGYQYFFDKKQDLERELPFGHQSIEILKGYGPAMDILGEPIKVKQIYKNDELYKLEDKFGSAKIEIEGKKRTADLYIIASRKETHKDWRIDSLKVKYRGSPLKPIQFYGIIEK